MRDVGRGEVRRRIPHSWLLPCLLPLALQHCLPFCLALQVSSQGVHFQPLDPQSCVAGQPSSSFHLLPCLLFHDPHSPAWILPSWLLARTEHPPRLPHTHLASVSYWRPLSSPLVLFLLLGQAPGCPCHACLWPCHWLWRGGGGGVRGFYPILLGLRATQPVLSLTSPTPLFSSVN